MRKMFLSRSLPGLGLVTLMMVVPVHGADVSVEDEGEVVTGVLTEYDEAAMQASIQTDVERVVRVPRPSFLVE